MGESTWSILKRMLADEYDALRRQLAKQVGSEDLAGDALQDTFIRLSRGGEIADNLESPRGYLYQIAFNFARGRTRQEKRRLGLVDIDATLEAVDDQPSPEDVVAARSDLQAMERALAELPTRRREIFVLAWFDGVPNSEIAVRYKISLRMVQIEVRRATEEVTRRLEELQVVDFASRRRQASSE